MYNSLKKYIYVLKDFLSSQSKWETFFPNFLL